MEWINVNDRLPEKGLHVLVVNETGKPYIAMLTDRLNWIDEFTEPCRVHYWMLLPEPPKL